MSHQTLTAQRLCIAFTIIHCMSALHASDYWPQWAGPNRNFTTKTGKLADSWPKAGPPRLWERDLGAGYAMILVDENSLYAAYLEGDQDVIAALDPKNGASRWAHRYKATLESYGPNATPLLVKDRLIGISVAGDMYCLSKKDGKVLWSHNLIKDFGGKELRFGYSASPLLYKGKVITLVGGQAGLIAFNPEDGSITWKSKAMDISYTSPQLINVDGQDQIVFFSDEEVIGVDAGNGEKLWSRPSKNGNGYNATDTIWGADNLLWVATQLEPGGRGFKLSRKNAQTVVEEVWANNRVRIHHWNAIRLNNYVYASIGDSATTLAAINMKTGDIAWRQRGFDMANHVYADGKLISLTINGDLVLTRVSPEKAVEQSRFKLFDTVCRTSPTLVGDVLYVRDQERLVAFDLGVK